MSRYNSDYLAGEISTIVLKKNARFKIALIYPNTYAIGMSNLGVHSVYDIFNSNIDVVCERVFFDSRKKQLFSIETGQALKSFDILAFSISYELDYFNCIEILRDLDMLVPSDQRPARPLIIMGGIVHSFNHRPLANYSDLIFIGEAEETIPLFIKTLAEFPHLNSLKKKNEFLREFSGMDGFFVPGVCDSESVKPSFVQDVNEFPVNSKIITGHTEFANTFLVEISRGCPWKCKFCVTTGVCGKFRSRSMAVLTAQIESGLEITKKIGLVGAAVSDYPQIDELVTFLLNKNAKISVSSLRIETVKQSLLEALVISGQKTITFAPEAGSDRLRFFLNKKITNKQILEIIYLTSELGIKKIKLYFMIGLPTEEDKDISAIVQLVKDVAQIVFVKASIGIFVPKPKTPFSDQSMCDKNNLLKKIKFLKSKLSNLSTVDFSISNIKEAYVSYLLSRADQNFFRQHFEQNR